MPPKVLLKSAALSFAHVASRENDRTELRHSRVNLEGREVMNHTRLLAALLIAAAALPGQAVAAPAATVVLLVGNAVAESGADKTAHALARGATVESGETITTGANSYVNMHFADGSYVMLRPSTRFQIEQYSFQGTPPVEQTKPGALSPTASGGEQSGPSKAFFRLLRGGLRTVSGLIGHRQPDDYKLTAVNAVLGIRGTDYVAIVCDAACANDPSMAGLPAGTTGAGGLVAGDISGAIAVTGGGDGPVLSANQYGLLTSDGAFYSLPGKPQFIKADRYIGSDPRTPASCQ
jgi:hypothetical protein